MGFNLEQLQTIAQNQNYLMRNAPNAPVQRVGRYEAEYTVNSDFIKLINSLIIYKMVNLDISPEKFSEVLRGSIKLKSSFFGRSETYEFDTDQPNYEKLADVVLNNYKDATDAKIKNFFALLQKGFFISNPLDSFYSSTDSFFEKLADNSKTISENFPAFKDLMGEMQIPQPTGLQAKEKRQNYLEALATRIDILGPKARIFRKYGKKLDLYKVGDEAVGKRKALLTSFLTKPTPFRDGFIDAWERELVPEVHRGS